MQPILDYGCEIWYNGKSRTRLESVQTTYIKRTLGVKPQTSNLAIYGETGRYPFLTRQPKLALRYWLKVIKLDNINPLKIVYRELYELDNNGHETWCTHVRSFLHSIALKDVWDTQNIPPEFQNIEHLKSKINTALEDKYIRGWTSHINNRNVNPILRTYANFKSNFIAEPYLTSLRVKRYQMNQSQFPPVRYRKRTPPAPRHTTTREVMSLLHKRQSWWRITLSSKGGL